MRRSKELVVLLLLMVGTMAFVLWYVADRKAKNREEAARPLTVVTPDTPPHVAGQPPTTQSILTPEPTSLGGANDKKTIDFSSGQPVVKDSPEDRAAMDAALKEMAEASAETTFGPTAKKPNAPQTPKP